MNRRHQQTTKRSTSKQRTKTPEKTKKASANEQKEEILADDNKLKMTKKTKEK
ncbi:9861_t:CDS:1, partial [Gigaspora rosea]